MVHFCNKTDGKEIRILNNRKTCYRGSWHGPQGIMYSHHIGRFGRFISVCVKRRQKRVKVENCLFIDCWYGGSKLDMNLFSSPFVTDMLKLDRGMAVLVNITGKSNTFPTILLLSVMLLVLCIAWMNIMAGCSWCLNKGMKINNRYCFPNCVLDKSHKGAITRCI